MTEAVQGPAAIPPPGYRGPRSRTSRLLADLGVGESFTAPYLERSTVTGLARYWGKKLKRQFVSRRDRKNRSRLRVYRLA